MNSLAALFPDTNNGELQDKAKELSHIRKELKAIREDSTLKPSLRVRKLKELRESLNYCKEEYVDLARGIVLNFI